MKKKLYLLLPVALLLLTSSGYAAQTNDIVHKIRILKNTIHTRSLTDVPDASIQNDVLSVTSPASEKDSSASSSPDLPANTRDTSPSIKYVLLSKSHSPNSLQSL